jgi:hypothetical protein
MIIEGSNRGVNGLETEVGSKRARLADNSSVADQHSLNDSSTTTHHPTKDTNINPLNNSKNNPNPNPGHHHQNKMIEHEVDLLRSELEDTKRQLREKTVEVEKSTQLFIMFDQ